MGALERMIAIAMETCSRNELTLEEAEDPKFAFWDVSVSTSAMSGSVISLRNRAPELMLQDHSQRA